MTPQELLEIVFDAILMWTLFNAVSNDDDDDDSGMPGPLSRSADLMVA